MKSVSYKQHEKHSTSQGTEPTDGMLLRQSLAGDEYAFEALVSRYRTPLLNAIRRLLKDDEQAYDVLQFVLLRLYDSQPTLQTDVSLRGWLFQVARHRCLDELRKQRCRPSIHFSELCWEDENDGIALLESIPDPQPLPEEIVEQRDLHTVLHQAIHSLPPRFRWVVHLHCFGHLTFSEIGRTLKMPVPTAKAYYYRALPLLRFALANNTALSLSA
jgi:RNA polymerase sigma factor (sigma-70 family)